MNKSVQIRLRVPRWEDVVQYIGDYIMAADRCFAFNHNLPDNNHYHVYLFDIDTQPDSIRKKLHRYLPKQNYSVSTTAGKEKLPITPLKAYQYGTTKDLIEPCFFNGYEQTDIDVFKDSAVAHYGQPQTPLTVTQVIREEHHNIKPDRVWERLVDQIDKYKDKSVKQIKSMIAAQWINDGKAIPRPSDLHRYAISIHYRLKYFNKDWEYQVPDWALEGEYA